MAKWKKLVCLPVKNPKRCLMVCLQKKIASAWYRRQKRQTPYRRQSIKTYHLRTGVVVCLKMVLRWSHWKNISWSDKLNRLGHFTKLPWDLEVFSQSVESWRMFGFKLVRTGCGTLKIQFRWKLNCRSKCLELPRRNLRRKFSRDRTKSSRFVQHFWCQGND